MAPKVSAAEKADKKADKKLDKTLGIKQGSAQDIKKDKAAGVYDEEYGKGTKAKKK